MKFLKSLETFFFDKYPLAYIGLLLLGVVVLVIAGHGSGFIN